MQEGSHGGNREQQRRQVPCLHITILHVVIAIATRVQVKFRVFLAFLGSGFYHLDAANCLGQSGVHFTKLFAHPVGHRVEFARVIPQRHQEARCESSGASNSCGEMNPMKVIVITRLENESKMASKPGTTMLLNWLISLAARAMISPTRCRL